MASTMGRSSSTTSIVGMAGEVSLTRVWLRPRSHPRGMARHLNCTSVRREPAFRYTHAWTACDRDCVGAREGPCQFGVPPRPIPYLKHRGAGCAEAGRRAGQASAKPVDGAARAGQRESSGRCPRCTRLPRPGSTRSRSILFLHGDRPEAATREQLLGASSSCATR